MEPYKKLLTFQLSEEIYDMTVAFCKKHLAGYDNFRTRDQMIQAARSGKQNIVEGSLGRSLKNYIKLVGVARASLGELLEDYRDYSRTNSISLWEPSDSRFKQFIGKRQTILPHNPNIPHKPEVALNYLINLICRCTYLLDRQIRALEQKFTQEGGYSENLFKKRMNYRNRIQYS